MFRTYGFLGIGGLALPGVPEFCSGFGVPKLGAKPEASEASRRRSEPAKASPNSLRNEGELHPTRRCALVGFTWGLSWSLSPATRVRRKAHSSSIGSHVEGSGSS